jgi:ABC-2 type transport system ATP-binding protein
LKEQIGGDVVSVGSRDPSKLRAQIEKRFSVKTSVVDHTIRIERPRGHEFIPVLVEAFPGEIDSISVGKPTLEDVFIHLTGHHFEGEQA